MSLLKRPQINLIMNLKRQGKSIPEIREIIGKRFGIKVSDTTVNATFHKHKAEYDLKTIKSTVEIKSDLTKKTIMNDLLKLIQTRKYIPIATEFYRHSSDLFSASSVERHYGSFDGLVKAAREKDPKVFQNIIDESLFTDESFKALRAKISENKRFIITTAITGCDPHEDALAAVRTYCKSTGAFLLVLPCSDPAKSKEHKGKWSLSDKLPKESIVFKDVALNDNIGISTIKMSAKQLQPLTGIKRISQSRGSTIVASPKQFLEFAPNSNNNTEIPRALMSTGAITKAQYRTDMYMSERTAYLAEQDHTLGAIIVEIKNGKIFFFRTVTFDKRTGAFCDIDKKYHANGKVEKITADLIQTGDWHVMSTCPQTRQMAKELVTLLKPKYLTFEDFFDGISINPHEKGNVLTQSIRAKAGLMSLETELIANQRELDELCEWPAENIVMKYGNHEDFLKRYLTGDEFLKQPQNKILAMKLTIALEEDRKAPFEYAMRVLFPIKNQSKVRFLSVDDSFKVKGIENGAHGHKGKAGRRNPGLAEVEDCYGAANVGHNHSSGIFRSVYRVGTGTNLQLSYNDGPSAWTQTHLIQHSDKSRQLIHNIKGEWRLKD